MAQPTITSVVPARGSIGASPTASVVFTFSEAINPDGLLVVQFFDDSPNSAGIPVALSWNSPQNTILTCTPEPSFPADALISWSVLAMNYVGSVLSDSGSFRTENAPTGTNAITRFVLSKQYSYQQSSTNLPVVNGTVSCDFQAIVSLASNRTSGGIKLTLPNAAISNLVRDSLAQENYALTQTAGTPAPLTSVYGDGNYKFTVYASASNQQVTLNMPTTHPNPPGITNQAAAQAVNSAANFRLGWTAFSGGTAADVITVTLSDGSVPVSLPSGGVLDGTQTGLTLPAGTLAPDRVYEGYLTFARATKATYPTYSTEVRRSSTTRFYLVTTAGISEITLRNPAREGASFAFEVRAPQGSVVVECKRGMGSAWSTLTTTNSTGAWMRITDPQAGSYSASYYRARTGS